MLGHGASIGYTGPGSRMGPTNNFSLVTGSLRTIGVDYEVESIHERGCKKDCINRATTAIRPSVRPSTKSFFHFNEILLVGI